VEKVFSKVDGFQIKKEGKFMHAAPISGKRLWTGRILSALAVLFLIFDGVTKVMKERHVLAASAQLGIPVSTTVGIGILLLACTAIYAIPRTSILGAIPLTGYLGGAVAIQARIGNPPFETIFPVLFGGLVWAGIFLRDNRLRSLVPLRS
jgi:hypothetical protein